MLELAKNNLLLKFTGYNFSISGLYIASSASYTTIISKFFSSAYNLVNSHRILLETSFRGNPFGLMERILFGSKYPKSRKWAQQLDPNSPIHIIIAVHNDAILVMICRLWNSSICMKDCSIFSRLISGAPLQLSTSCGCCFGWAGTFLCHYTVSMG